MNRVGVGKVLKVLQDVWITFRPIVTTGPEGIRLRGSFHTNSEYNDTCVVTALC